MGCVYTDKASEVRPPALQWKRLALRFMSIVPVVPCMSIVPLPCVSIVPCPLSHCHACPSTSTFLAAVKNTWISNICGAYVGINTCQRWVFALEANLPEFGRGSPCVKFAGAVTFRRKSRWSPAHVAHNLVMCNGAVFYADNRAWGGDDHIFWPTEIPPTVTPISPM